MAAIGPGSLTLIDWAKRLDPDGRIATIIEILAETNEILQDMAVLEGNLPTGHRTTIRSGYPTVTWRKLNYGVQPSKSRTVQVTDTAGMLETYSEIDKSLADLNGNTGEFRMSEDRAFLEAMSQEMANTLFYGDTATEPEKFLGLAPRYSVKTGVELGDNIILGGGSGADNTSVWLVVWGSNTCHSFFPKGQTAGLQFEDLGQETLTDAAGGRYEGYRTHYKWDIGMSLRDWRYVVRIPNIDISDLTKDASAGADLNDLMVQAQELVPNIAVGRSAFYCNRTIKSFLRRQINNKANVQLTEEQVGGQTVMRFAGTPVRRCDAILNNEALVA
jgi:hypothetical protein